MSQEGLDLIRSLLKLTPKDRLGYNELPSPPYTADMLRETISYDEIKSHPFFTTSYDGHTPIDFKEVQSETFLKSSKLPLRTLTELYLEGVCESAMEGLRPKLHLLNTKIRNKVKHYFRIRRKLSEPDVVRLFYKSRMESTFMKAEDRGVLGFSQPEEDRYNKPFYFIQVSHPSIGSSLDSPAAARLKSLIDAANAIKPRPSFFVCIGDLTEHGCDEVDSDTYGQEVANYKRLLCNLAPTITVISIGSSKNFGKPPLTDKQISNYRAHFGDDYFRFWKGGICFIVINSVLLQSVEKDFMNVDEIDVEENEISTSEIMKKRWKHFNQNYRDKTAWGRHVEWVKQSLFLSRTNSKQAVILSSHLLKSNDEQDSSDPLKLNPSLPLHYSKHLLAKMKWSYCKTALSPHRTRSSRVLDKTTSEGYEANDVTCITTMASNGFRVVRMFDDSVRTAYHTLGENMVKSVSLKPEDNVETVVVKEDDRNRGFNFKSEADYEKHLASVTTAVTTDEPINELGIAGLNIAPRNVASGTDARAETDEDDSDDGELVVEDVTNEV